MSYSQEFLKEIDLMKIRAQYIKITLLSFDEQPISELQGTITNGTLQCNGSAAVRRTISFTATTEDEDIENIDYIISLNKKVKIQIGIKGPQQSEIAWFKCGIFIINDARTSHSTSGSTISVSAKDKMAMLDGTAGGTFPASINFHEVEIKDYSNPENTIIAYPLIFNIIQTAVIQFGGEHINNIIINDVPSKGKQILKWTGDLPLYINANSGSVIVGGENLPVGYIKFTTGDDVCYEETDLTYPGELIMNAGENVVSLLDKISKTLGNYEFFYDIDGKFVFQQKKNYLNTLSPLLDLTPENYLKVYSNEQTIWSFENLETVDSISKNPKFENIKNDYIVWGMREGAGGADVPIRYHLAIDEKPSLDKSLMYMFEIRENDKVVRYDFDWSNIYTKSNVEARLICGPAPEWREELFRNALEAQYTTGYYSYYDAEILDEWRKLFDPNKEEWQETNSWNPAVFNDPRTLDYWLDFIDTESLRPYSVNAIGRRTKSVNDNKAKTLINKNPIDIVAIRRSNFKTEQEYRNAIDEKRQRGQAIVGIGEETVDAGLVISSTGASAFEKIRDLLYQHLNYNTTLTISCLPLYHLEPNQLIYIHSKKGNINNNYAITQFSLPLGYNGKMSITATEAQRRL